MEVQVQVPALSVAAVRPGGSRVQRVRHFPGRPAPVIKLKYKLRKVWVSYSQSIVHDKIINMQSFISEFKNHYVEAT